MNQANQTQYSINKAYRWRPLDYLSNHINKRGKTFFSNSKTDNNAPDIFRKTQFHLNPKLLKDLVISDSPMKQDHSGMKKRRGSNSKKTQIRFEKSPYLSHSTEIQKMMRLLIPVKGPNQSLKLQIKRHNDMNLRNAQLLIVKKTEGFADRMKAYSHRMGLSEDTKIFMMNSRDIHMKQALKRRGWVQSGDKYSILYHLKWVYKDKVQDYGQLQEGQLYNHFRNNQELTNKNQLKKNIKKYNSQLRPNFPLSFDLQLNQESVGFQQAYLMFQYYKILNRLGLMIERKYKSKATKVQKMSLFRQNLNKKKQNKQIASKCNLDELLYTVPHDFTKAKSYIWQGLLNLFEIICSLAQILSKQLGVAYSVFKAKNCQKDNFKMVQRLQYDLQYRGDEIISSLTPFYITEILKMWQHSKRIVGSSYGYNNMWIIKPAGVARGSGITITDNLIKISQLRYGKIIQKYIEHPLILNCKRKFDIRQWILIKSFTPLRAYAFKKCYGRFSSCRYSNENYDNLQKHLTNYTQNKQIYLRQKIQLKQSSLPNLNNRSAMEQKDLQIQIPSWRIIKQNILINILKTLQCCKSEVLQKQQCFEVFGFDIILDQTYKPFILEVNMSPACQNRQFLGEYLSQMAEGLVDMIEGGQPTNWISLSLEEFSKRLKERQLLQKRQQKAKTIQKWWKKLHNFNSSI